MKFVSQFPYIAVAYAFKRRDWCAFFAFFVQTAEYVGHTVGFSHYFLGFHMRPFRLVEYIWRVKVGKFECGPVRTYVIKYMTYGIFK